MSTTPEDRRESEQGYRKQATLPEHSVEYLEGEHAARYLLGVLHGGFATSQALRQALHEVMARGRADMLRGFCDTLQAALQAGEAHE